MRSATLPLPSSPHWPPMTARGSPLMCVTFELERRPIHPSRKRVVTRCTMSPRAPDDRDRRGLSFTRRSLFRIPRQGIRGPRTARRGPRRRGARRHRPRRRGEPCRLRRHDGFREVRRRRHPAGEARPAPAESRAESRRRAAAAARRAERAGRHAAPRELSGEGILGRPKGNARAPSRVPRKGNPPGNPGAGLGRRVGGSRAARASRARPRRGRRSRMEREAPAVRRGAPCGGSFRRRPRGEGRARPHQRDAAHDGALGPRAAPSPPASEGGGPRGGSHAGHAQGHGRRVRPAHPRGAPASRPDRLGEQPVDAPRPFGPPREPPRLRRRAGRIRAALHPAGARRVIEIEMNAATDNPMVFAETGTLVSGGNFHAAPVALVCDLLTASTADMASLSERRTERLVNPALSGDLPAFLTRDGGLNSGLMMIHVTAAALVSEAKSNSFPASVDSIPTSAGEEDHVSMGPIAARKLLKNVDLFETVLAIELLAAAQALDLRRPLVTSPPLEEVHRLVRARVPFWDADRHAAPAIEGARAVLASDLDGVLAQLA